MNFLRGKENGMDIMSKAQREACQECIHSCMHCRDICEKIIDSNRTRGVLATDQQLYDNCRDCIAACTHCIKHMNEFLKTCVDAATIKKVEACIKACKECISACQEAVRQCEATEPTLPELESEHGPTCVRAVSSCLLACQTTIKACQVCLEG